MAQQKRIGPPVVPPEGRPFAGATGLNAPARNTKIPNLTAHVAEAKARKSALQSGGLVPEDQRKAASEAGKTLAAHKAAKRAASQPKDAPRTLASAPAKPKKPRQSAPIQLGAPPAAPLASAPQRTPAPASSTNSPGSRGAPSPRGYVPNNPQTAPVTPGPNFTSLGGGESWGHALRNAAHGIDLGLGTSAAVALAGLGIGPSSVLTAKVNAPGALRTTSQAASQLSNAGLNLPTTIPSVDIVGAGAASRTKYTPQALVAAGLTPQQTTRFRNLALKQGWHQGEIDGLVGLDLIKHAYSKPPPLALRIAQNFGAGVIRTGSLPVAGVAIGQEVASGHGTRALKEIGQVAAKQVGGAISHPGTAFVDDPYAFIPVAGGALKTLGGIGGKVAEKAGKQAVERSVEHAVTGAAIPRGVYARNLYTATGQHIADAAVGKSAFLSKRADARSVDKLVSDVANDTAPIHHGVQVAFAKAFKKVGPKRAEVLAAFNASGGMPEKVLAYYQHAGNARQVKFWKKVTGETQGLRAARRRMIEDRVAGRPIAGGAPTKDEEFLAAHQAMGKQTGETHVELGRFSDTAAVYRSHQPLILSAAHLGDPVAQRVQALHDEWTKALRTTDNHEELAPLFGAYDHAVREFAQGHLDSGGIEPTRVAYTPPPATGVMTSPYKRGTGGRVRFNARVPGQKASTGAAFESGNYLIDPKVALRENLQAQRLRTSVGLTSDESLAKIGAIKAERGDERPHGYVFTPSQNPATVGKVISDLHDQPVGAHDYYHQEASIRDRFAKSLEHNADATGEHAATQGWFVPEGAWNRILDYTRPESRNAYDKFMRQYQRAMISIFPSTLLGNTVGSVPLALAAGAGPKSFLEAARASSLGGDISRSPHSLHGRGVAGNLASDARNPATKYMNTMRRGNVIGEDFSRDAVYFSHVTKGADKRAKELGYPDTGAYYRDVAAGKVDVHVRDAGIAKAIKFAGDAAKPATKTGQRLGKVILFPQWLQHMTRLMLVTLPLHHPRRMALINALAAYGDQYRKENGVLPSWMQEFAPLFDHTAAGSTFTRAVGVGQLAPQGTAGGIFDTLSQSGPITSRIAGLANPPIAAVLNTGVQEIKNQGSHYPLDMGRYMLNQALYTIPGVAKAFPRTGMEGDSLPWSPRPFVYTNGTRKSAWNPDNTLPANQRPGNRPLGGWEGILSRAFGLPLYDVPSSGKINKATVDKAIAKQQPKTKAFG